MPYRVVCHKCGCELEQGFSPAPDHFYESCGVPYYTKVRERHNGKCPKCGRKLAHEPIEIKVFPNAK